MRKLAAKFICLHPDIKVNVYQIRNDFFGEMITVSGLLTGQDLKAQLMGQNWGMYCYFHVTSAAQRRRSIFG